MFLPPSLNVSVGKEMADGRNHKRSISSVGKSSSCKISAQVQKQVRTHSPPPSGAWLTRCFLAGAYAADPYAYDPPPGPYVPGMAFGGVGYGTSFHVLIHVFSRGVSRAEPERQKPRRRRVTGRVSRRMGSTIWIRTLRTWIRRIWTIWIRRVLSPPRGPLGPCGRPDRAPGYDDGRPRVAGGAADVWRLWAILAN